MDKEKSNYVHLKLKPTTQLVVEKAKWVRWFPEATVCIDCCKSTHLHWFEEDCVGHLAAETQTHL